MYAINIKSTFVLHCLHLKLTVSVPILVKGRGQR